jgi:hypothetical protein
VGEPGAVVTAVIGGVLDRMYQMAEVHVYEIRCPRCSAAPGVGCLTRTGKPMEFPHRERNQAIRDREARTGEAKASRQKH